MLNGEVGEDVMQVKKLFKRYKRKGKQAVDQLTFGVRRAECFGLLGKSFYSEVYSKSCFVGSAS